MFSIAVIGGILLNIGAFFTMKGWIYQSVLVYLFADVCWIILAYENRDITGMYFVLSGTVLGAIALYKMYTGRMERALDTHEENAL